MPENTFVAWVNSYGRANLARALGITWRAVYKWTDEGGVPRPELAHRIIDMSAGKLTLEDIYPRPAAADPTINRIDRSLETIRNMKAKR